MCAQKTYNSVSPDKKRVNHMKFINSALKRMLSAQNEDGQAIVLVALFMIVMLAMVGVAIDGGGLFLLWRDAQNAADTAALQAAYDRCTSASGTGWELVGLNAASINGFDNQNRNTVTVDNQTVGTLGYTHVSIRAEKPKYFIQLVYPGPLEVRAEALVYCSKAVDFSDLPGAIALGDCTCPLVEGQQDYDGGKDRVSFSGANFSFTGGVHSNCDIDVNPGGGQNGGEFVGESPTATGSTNDHNKPITYPAGEDATTGNGAEPVLADPLGLNIAMYAPGGEIYDNVAIKAFHNGDWNASGMVQGLHYVNGDASLKAPTVSIGPNGLTVVATGKIEGQRPDDVTWRYYGWNGANTGDYGVAAEFESGYWPYMLAFSTHDNTQTCQNGMPGAQSAVTWGTSDHDAELDVLGVIYAPRGWINWSGNNLNGRGAMIGWGIDMSGSEISWIYEPNMLPPRAPTLNNVK
jgi:Putative Flp pilus-assembly TadE/G-like